MVREMVTINIGQAGIQLSQSIWSQYLAEHDMDNDGMLKKGTNDKNESGDLGTFFMEGKTGKYVPRNISVDLEPNVIDDIKNGSLSKLFCKEYLINHNEDAANNFARGRYV